MSGDSKLAVASALGGNVVVAVSKLVAFAFTGSGSMLSEGIHSIADVLNQTLLLIGMIRGAKDADDTHHYGYGRERYIWALMSAVGIFFLGCGVTVYHGIQSLMHPHEIGDLAWAFGVLGFSLLMEGSVLVLAFRTIKKAAGDQPFLSYLKHEADPGTVAVLMEDGAACAGIVIAFVGIVLTKVTGEVYWDAIGSITIGVLLGVIATWLIVRNHHSLMGQAVPREVERKVRTIVEQTPGVEYIESLKTSMLDGETFDFALEVEFDGSAAYTHLEDMVVEAWPGIDTLDDFKGFAKTYADEIVDQLGDEVDRLEERIRQKVPQAIHVDIESN